MNISIISPQAHNTGNTTLAILVALELASKGKKVCLTHSDTTSESFYNYCNLMKLEDKTSTPSQVVKLIREGAIKPSEISDYCKKLTDELEIFSNNSKAFTVEDMEVLIKYMRKSFPHDHIIFDVDVGVYDIYNNTISKMIIDLSDIVIMNITQSIQQLDKFRENKDNILSALGNKPVIVVINKFCDIQGSIKEVANWMGIKKPNNWLILRYNPWVNWGTNHGKILEVYNRMKLNDDRLLDVASDIIKIGNTINKIGMKIGAGKAGAN